MSAEDTGRDDRPTRYVEDDRVIYRASGLGSCTRALVAMAYPNVYVPAEKPEWFQTILDQGTEFEDAIRQRYMSEREAIVANDQLEVELELGEMFGREVIVRGHIDGIADVDTTHRLFEAKKFRDSTWPNFLSRGIEVNVNYPWQVAVYMHALDLDECDFVGGHVTPMYDELGNLTGEWELVEIAVKHLAQPPFSLKAIRNRIFEVEKLINAGFDAKEVECQRSMYPCPFFKLHDYDEDAWSWSGEDAQTADAWMTSLAAVGEQAKAAKAALEAAEAKKQEVVRGFREFLAESGDQALAAKKLEGSEFVVSHVRKTIPAHMRKAVEQDYFTIKPIKKDG